MKRLIAFILILLPGLIAVFGVKIMRDTLFQEIVPPFSSLSFQFISGLFMFFLGLAFIGGFIFRRDQKRNKVKKRLRRR